MSETKECIVCGNPFDYEGEICYYCEVINEMNQEEDMSDNQPQPGEVVEPSHEHPATAEIVQTAPELPADVPEDNGETVDFKVLLVKDDEGAARLEQAFKDGFLLSQGQSYGDGVVEIMTKVTPKEQQ